MNRNRILLLVLGVPALVVVVFALQGTVFLGILYQTDPWLLDITVASHNETHERITWETNHPSNGSVDTLVHLDSGGWHTVDSVHAGTNTTSHASTTDVHAVDELTFRNETIDPDEVDGYQVQAVARWNGEREAVELVRANATEIVRDGAGLRVRAGADGSGS